MKCTSHNQCSHNTNDRDLNKPCSIEFPKKDGARVFRANLYKDRLVFIGSDGWPVTGIKGRPIITLLRRLLHTRKVERYHKWLKRTGVEISFV